MTTSKKESSIQVCKVWPLIMAHRHPNVLAWWPTSSLNLSTGKIIKMAENYFYLFVINSSRQRRVLSAWLKDRKRVKSCTRNIVKNTPNLISSINPWKTGTGTGEMPVIPILRLDRIECQAILVHIAWMHFQWLFIQSTSPKHSPKLPAKTLIWEEIVIQWVQ